MADHYSNIPPYRALKNIDQQNKYESYFEELQAKSHNFACCFVRMKYNNPNHPVIPL